MDVVGERVWLRLSEVWFFETMVNVARCLCVTVKICDKSDWT